MKAAVGPNSQFGELETNPGTIGRYTVIRPISTGGMGDVYLAEQEAPRRLVAIKVLRRVLGNEVNVERFRVEMDTLAAMSHPSISRLYDADALPDGRPYFVMEYVDGVPVTVFCDRHSLDIRGRLRLFLTICDAVHHAHQKGIIHRDLKPSNILVTEVDGPPIAKVIDFGIAKTVAGTSLADRSLTHVGEILGTPSYMSPEQTVAGADFDIRSDVYSLGVLLYELLTGVLPFEESVATDEFWRRIREEDPPRPSRRIDQPKLRSGSFAFLRTSSRKQTVRQFRGELDWIVMRALEKDRSQRYASTSELSADIRRYLDDEPITARPPTALYYLRKFARRHRIGVISSATAALALVMGLAATATMYTRAERARKDALWSSYLANLRAASASLREYDGGEARRRLADCDPALRGWEWRHLRRRSELSVTAQRFGGGRVWAAWNPAGDLIAAACGDGVLRLWTPGSGRTLHRNGPGGALNAVAFSPDGSRVAAVSSGGLARIWSAPFGVPLLTIDCELGHLNSLDWSPDGGLIATGGERSEIRIWNARTGEFISDLTGHQDDIAHVRFSPDGRMLASSSSDGTVRLWEIGTGRPLHSLKLDTFQVNSVSFSPDGTTIAAASLNRKVQLWDTRTGEPGPNFEGPTGFANDVEFSPDGRDLVATGGKTALLWNLTTQHLLTTLVGHDGYVYSVSFSPDGEQLVTGSDDGTIRIWTAGPPNAAMTLQGHDGPVHAVAYVPKSKLLVTAGADGTIRIWNPASSQSLRVIEAHEGGVQSIALSPDGKQLLSGGGRGGVRIWDLATGQPLRTLQVPARAVTDVAWSADGSWIAYSSDASVMLLSATGGPVQRELQLKPARVRGLQFGPTSHQLAVAAWGESSMWSLDGPVPERKVVIRGNANQALLAPNGAAILIATWEGRIEIHDATSGRRIASLPGGGGVMNALAVGPDGRRIASGASDGYVRIWDRHTGELLAALWGHEDEVLSLAWSQDGHEIASASADGTIRLWRD